MGTRIFVGLRERSGELWVATKTGEVRNVRAVKRIPEEERGSEDWVRWVKGTLWHKYSGDPEEDGEIPEGKAAEVEEDEEKKQKALDDQAARSKKKSPPISQSL